MGRKGGGVVLLQNNATHALRLHGTKVTFLLTFEVVSGGGLEGGGGGGVVHS